MPGKVPWLLAASRRNVLRVLRTIKATHLKFPTGSLRTSNGLNSHEQQCKYYSIRLNKLRDQRAKTMVHLGMYKYKLCATELYYNTAVRNAEYIFYDLTIQSNKQIVCQPHNLTRLICSTFATSITLIYWLTSLFLIWKIKLKLTIDQIHRFQPACWPLSCVRTALSLRYVTVKWWRLSNYVFMLWSLVVAQWYIFQAWWSTCVPFDAWAIKQSL